MDMMMMMMKKKKKVEMMLRSLPPKRKRNWGYVGFLLDRSLDIQLPAER